MGDPLSRLGIDDSLIPDPAGRAARMLEFADLLTHPSATRIIGFRVSISE